eukprot:UN03732
MFTNLLKTHSIDETFSVCNQILSERCQSQIRKQHDEKVCFRMTF